MPISDVADINVLTVGRTYPHNEIEYVDITSVSNRRIVNIEKLELNEAPSRAKRIVRDNDILISTVRPNLKHFCFVRKAAHNLIASTGFVVVSAKQAKADPYFLYYLLTTDAYTNKLSRIADGHTSAYPSFNPEVIENSAFPMPSLPEQKSVADILSSLDDKIELLRKQNETLEQIAQTLFNEQFVKKSTTLATIGEIADHIKDSVNPAKRSLEVFSHYSIPAFDDNKTPVSENGSQIMSNKYCVPDNSILFSKLNPDTPRVWAVFNAEDNPICSTEFQVLKPKEEKYFAFLYALLRFSGLARELANKVQGTSSSHQRLKPSDIFALEFPKPTEEALTAYNSLAYPLLKKIDKNERQMRTQGTVRDLLLPKLMRGEVRVQE